MTLTDTPTVGTRWQAPDTARMLHNPYAVRRWLEAKQPDEVAGQASSTTRCTLHNFLADTTGRQVSVSPTTYRVRGNPQKVHPMPAWAYRFVVCHDTINGGRGKAPVTVAQALHALAWALGETLPETEWEARAHAMRP